ncbi:sulfatase-like hydrolase/transferase [Devosia rhodophyticola]|uniref:Sulfatase-like hydrolase/transferase n=1 Tax=Devosia rhodophyticola TaxID=3026423 RepID=A0ABY7YV40_9HYPH|nr:sulfatase-like hydrolase/transferase [Devosia rhodophyticola]WDR05225.1 sulfatase-like hydrolase/transferase [Devosia rhodophyticola]
MKPQNLIVIMADEHRRDYLGASGHPLVQTPNIDALAARGTRFTAAYTPSPLCVPARSSFATGKPIRDVGAWCNACAYTGEQESWHHRLREAGHHVHSIGKLHYRGAEGDDNGFSESEVPMNIVDGLGDVLGLIRNRNIERGAANKMADMAGPGESVYTTYDRDISGRAQVWLRETAPQITDQPWVLFVSLVAPHFPLTAPPEFFYLYDQNQIEMPKQYGDDERPQHPYLDDYQSVFAYDRFFKDGADVKRAIAAYMGLCTFVDHQVGEILKSLDASGLGEETRIVYTSDHGDNLGARGLWGKSTLYEESVGIPLIVCGPDIEAGAVRDQPRSLIDVSRFILDATGGDSSGFGEVDLFSDAEVPVVSEYHGTGSRSGAFMLRSGRWKYVHYALYDAQLFDLEADPEELNDLADDPAYANTVKQCLSILLSRLDPKAVHLEALADQRRRIDALGGEGAILAREDYGFSPPPGVRARVGQ